MEVVPSGRDVGGHDHLAEIGDLVGPVRVHQRIALCHAALVVDAEQPAGARRGEVGELDAGNAALVERLAVHVGHALPRGDAGQVGRLFGSDVPLADGERGGPGHSDPAVAPGLLGAPFDEVVAVLGILLAELLVVAARVADAADVHVDDGVAVGDPVFGVGGLELRGRRDGALGHAGRVRDELVGSVLVGALAVVRPGQDGRHLGGVVGGAEHVGVQDDAVAHGHRDVLIADDSGRRYVRALVERVGLVQLLLVIREFLEFLDGRRDELLGVELVDDLVAHLGRNGELFASE